jgi:4-amino-4-deoxy-L-arabinose transferase-like glycosyltransferase
MNSPVIDPVELDLDLDEVSPWQPPTVVDPDHQLARWERPALAGLLAATAMLYLWGLGASGWANSFYSAAAQAGSQSWKAWFFGSSDAANSITVDKPPASLWFMGLSVRMFGLSTWSLLVPQALMGVGTVGVIYASVRRRCSAWTALLAGAALATTPVAALMFRFNNPDALLTLLMSLAAWATLRGLEDGRRRWIVLTGVLLGFGFLTKQLQVLLVVPALALAWLVAAHGSWRRRVVDLLAGGAAMVAAAGWWIAIVSLWPASSRPYIGGSQTNSILELTLGYNGFGRLTGDETGSVGAGGNGGNWGTTGITRMVDGVIGGQIAWLFPAAIIALVAGTWATRRRPRTDITRAALIVWGGWFAVTALVFSFMAGIFHEYYTVALAPALAALVGIGAHLWWQRRTEAAASITMAVAVASTSVWSFVLLGRAADWNAWLRPVILVLGLGTAAGIAAGARLRPRMVTALVCGAAVACLAGPTAWAVSTAATPHTGSIVTAGPTVSGTFGIGGPAGGRAGGPGGIGGPGGQIPTGPMGTPPTGGQIPTGPMGTPPDGAPGGGMGGLLDATDVSDEVVELLADDADSYRWVAAAVGSNRASGFQLSTEEPVMAIGGFNGSDPSPTLAEFQQYVADGEIHWFIAGDGFGRSMGGSSESSEIATWVESNFIASTVGGVTLYDLSGDPSA